VSVGPGVAATLTIAWGAATVRVSGSQSSDDEPARASDLPAYLRGWWPTPRTISRIVDRRPTGGGFGVLCAPDDAWGTAAEGLTWDTGPLRPSLWRSTFGWPWAALYYDALGVSGGTKADRQSFLDRCVHAAGLRAGVACPGWLRPLVEDGGYRRFPVAPLPLGFAADSMVFGGGLQAVWAGPGLVRSWGRRRAGRCPACGYDRTALTLGRPCPECGSV
jgi:hypothetical protein